jgi:hypothetical protein
MDKESLELILKLQQERDDLQRAIIEIICMSAEKKDLAIINHISPDANRAINLVRKLITPQP